MRTNTIKRKKKWGQRKKNRERETNSESLNLRDGHYIESLTRELMMGSKTEKHIQTILEDKLSGQSGPGVEEAAEVGTVIGRPN